MGDKLLPHLDDGSSHVSGANEPGIESPPCFTNDPISESIPDTSRSSLLFVLALKLHKTIPQRSSRRVVRPVLNARPNYSLTCREQRWTTLPSSQQIANVISKPVSDLLSDDKFSIRIPKTRDDSHASFPRTGSLPLSAPGAKGKAKETPAPSTPRKTTKKKGGTTQVGGERRGKEGRTAAATTALWMITTQKMVLVLMKYVLPMLGANFIYKSRLSTVETCLLSEYILIKLHFQIKSIFYRGRFTSRRYQGQISLINADYLLWRSAYLSLTLASSFVYSLYPFFVKVVSASLKSPNARSRRCNVGRPLGSLSRKRNADEELSTNSRTINSRARTKDYTED